MVTLLMMCFPIVEDLSGYVRLGSPVTVSTEFTHSMILTALRFSTPSDSYICSSDVIEYDGKNRPPFKVYIPSMGWAEK